VKKKILSFALMICLILPCLIFVACDSTHHTWEVGYGYDENGAYCKFIECEDCGGKIKQATIVEAVTQTTAVLNGKGVTEIKYDEDNFYLDMTFDQAISNLSRRSVTGGNTKFIKTTIDSSEKPGLPLQGNIKLTKDIFVGYNGNTTLCFHITDEVTIDLNGHKISQVCGTDGMSGYALFVVRDGGVLNIIDSSQEKNGVINGVMSAIQINQNGVVNLYNGTVKCSSVITATDAKEEYFCIWTIATNGGTFNQYNGEVVTVESRWVIDESQHIATGENYAFASYGAGAFNIYGGNVDGEYEETAASQVKDLR